MSNNLPPRTISDSAAGTKLFFDQYGTAPIEFLATEVDATVAFFKKNGFDEDASLTTAMTLLTQAKIDSINIFDLLKNLSTISGVQLSALVTEILNNNRTASSTLGYRIPVPSQNKTRNILP